MIWNDEKIQLSAMLNYCATFDCFSKSFWSIESSKKCIECLVLGLQSDHKSHLFCSEKTKGLW